MSVCLSQICDIGPITDRLDTPKPDKIPRPLQVEANSSQIVRTIWPTDGSDQRSPGSFSCESFR